MDKRYGLNPGELREEPRQPSAGEIAQAPRHVPRRTGQAQERKKISGVIQNLLETFSIDLGKTVQEIWDQQDPPVRRVRIGILRDESGDYDITDYGLQVWDQDGNLIFDMSGPFVEAFPLLDEDDGDLYLYPNRVEDAQSVWYKVYLEGEGPPTLADVTQNGTLTTLDEVLVRTFTVEETVEVGVVAAQNADGSGTWGSLHVRRYTYRNADIVPAISWLRYDPGAGYEGVRIIATDDAATVAIYYRQWVQGSAVPGFSTTGQLADPNVLDIAVVRPEELDPVVNVEFYAEDAAGNTSDVLLVRVDGNLNPSGYVQVDLNRSTGVPIVKISTSDPDSGSWRMAVAIDSSPSILYSDSNPNEFSGNSFGGEGPDLSAFKLKKGEQLNGVIVFYRTSLTDDASQQFSRQSSAQTFSVLQKEETENKIRNAKLVKVQAADGTRTYRIEAQLGAATQSVKVAAIYVYATDTGCPHAGIPASWSYVINTTGAINATLCLADGVTPVSLSTSCLKGGVGSIALTPYDAVDGDAGTGDAGIIVGLNPIGDGAPLAGTGLQAADLGQWNRYSVKPDDFHIVSPTDPGVKPAGTFWIK